MAPLLDEEPVSGQVIGPREQPTTLIMSKGNSIKPSFSELMYLSTFIKKCFYFQ